MHSTMRSTLVYTSVPAIAVSLTHTYWPSLSARPWLIAGPVKLWRRAMDLRPEPRGLLGVVSFGLLGVVVACGQAKRGKFGV